MKPESKSKHHSKHHHHRKHRRHQTLSKNKHTLFATGESALKTSANSGLFDKLTIKETCQFRQLSKNWRFFVDNIPDNGLTFAKKFDLTDDYHAYLKEAIQDDLVLLQDYSWETMFALFAKQKSEIQKKIDNWRREDFNDWDSPDLGTVESRLLRSKAELLAFWLLQHSVRGDFVSVYYLLQAGAKVKTLRRSYVLTTWSVFKNSISPVVKNPLSWSAFEGAASYGSLASTKLLYRSLQTQNIKECYFTNYHVFTLLHYLAIAKNPYDYLNPELVKFYIDHGVDINSTTKYDMLTPLHLAVIEFPLHALLFHAIDKTTGKLLTHEMRYEEFQSEYKESFFEKLNIDIDHIYSNEAAWTKSFQMIDILIKFGANLYAKDKFGMQPIDYARRPKMFFKERIRDEKMHLQFIGKSYFEKCSKTNDHQKLKVGRFAILCGQKLSDYLLKKVNQIPEKSLIIPEKTDFPKLRIS